MDDEEVKGDEADLQESPPDDALPAAVGFEDDVVVMHGREFRIDEPSVGIVLRILNVIGSLGVKGERIAAAQLKTEVSARAAIMGILAGMSENDLYKFGSAVLQFDDDREGQKWLKEHGLKVAPLIRAFFVNWAKSEDLQEALLNFYTGVASLTATLSTLNLAVTLPAVGEG